MTVNSIWVAVKNDEICLRNPLDQKRLTTKGTRVVKNAFWTRRLKQGDCIQVDAPMKVLPLTEE